MIFNPANDTVSRIRTLRDQINAAKAGVGSVPVSSLRSDLAAAIRRFEAERREGVNYGDIDTIIASAGDL